jgi:pimeloyl-ACP methyl ester carboxylesterase
MNPQIEEQTVRSPDGTRIGFLTIGTGPALVIVHGALGTGDTWLPVATAMARYCQCYVMDRRGRGRSDDSVNYSLGVEIEDIEAVLKAAGPGSHLLGHSSGAIYALETVRRFPIGRLVLYEPPLHFQGLQAERLVDRMRVRVESNQFEEAAAIFAREEARLTEPELSALQATPRWPEMVALAPTFVREWAAIFSLGLSVERYQDISVPTLLLSGTQTENHPSFATKELERMMPNVRKAMLGGQGHGAHLAAPTVVATTVTDFLLQKAG